MPQYGSPEQAAYGTAIGDVQRERAQRQATLAQMLQMRGAAQSQEHAAQMGPLQAQLMQAQIADVQAKPQDRLDARAATREMALARLGHAARLAEATHEREMTRITDARQRAAEIARHNRVKEAIDNESLQISGRRLFYDTGMTTGSAGPTPAPAVAQPGVIRGSAPTDDEALRAVQAAESAGIQASMTGPVPQVAPAAPVARPVPLSPTTPIPRVSITEPAAPVMPAFVGSPRERAAAENRWKAQQSQSPTLLNRSVEAVGKAVENSNLAKVEGALSLVEDSIKDVNDLPGYGLTGPVPTFALSQAGKDLRTRLSRLFNMELKDRSGAAVTIQELERLKEEFASGRLRTDEDLKRALIDYRKILDGHKTALFAGFSPEAVAVYQQRATPKSKTAPKTINSKGWRLMTDANGNQAYVSPDGKQFEEIQ